MKLTPGDKSKWIKLAPGDKSGRIKLAIRGKSRRKRKFEKTGDRK